MSPKPILTGTSGLIPMSMSTTLETSVQQSFAFMPSPATSDSASISSSTQATSDHARVANTTLRTSTGAPIEITPGPATASVPTQTSSVGALASNPTLHLTPTSTNDPALGSAPTPMSTSPIVSFSVVATSDYVSPTETSALSASKSEFHLNEGTIVGLAIGMGVVAMCLVFGLCWCVSERRRRSAPPTCDDPVAGQCCFRASRMAQRLTRLNPPGTWLRVVPY